MKNKSESPVVIRLAENSGAKKNQELKAYVVDSSGDVVEQATFEGLEAKLKSTKSILHGARKIYVFQVFPKEVETTQITERMLVKAGAYQVVMNFSSENIIHVQRLPSVVFLPIPFGYCSVLGHVNKNFIIDGVQENLPICNARVHICNVDPIFLWPIYLQPILSIPDWILAELREKFINVSSVIQVIPKSQPPNPIGQISFLKGKVQLDSLGSKSTSAQKITDIYALNPLPDDVLSGLTSESTDTIRQTLIDNHDILYPYICLWPIFWSWFYWCEEEVVVYTDCNGHFEAWLYTLGENAELNVYIWVEVNINGQWVTVYRPPMPCHTWWDYACNADININVSDSRVMPCVCDPISGEIIWVKRVADGTSIRNIAQHASAAATPSLFADARGSTNSTGVEGNSYVSPFTSEFPFYIQFGDGFPAGSNTYYRWKYHRIADADLNSVSEAFVYQQGTLAKSYTYEGTDAHGNTVFYTGNFQLDTSISTGTIYRIPHVDASVDTGIATAEWNQDTASILIDAGNLGNGLFEFVLEVCDSSGNVQSVADNVFQVDSFLASPPNPASVPAGGVDASYLFHGVNNTAPLDPVTGFRFLIRIDNDPTSCSIGDAIVDNNDGTGSTTDTQCGFAQYKNKATGNILLCFSAEQPHDYAHYSFAVYKGNGGAVEVYEDQVPEPSYSKLINSVNTVYQENPSLTDLLGNCIQAAFSENIYVTAYHTNGSTRYYPYDTSGVAAFAIEPITN